MNTKASVYSLLLAGLLSSISFNASADQITPQALNISSHSFNQLLGNIVVNSNSDLTGSVFAAKNLNTDFGTFALDTVNFASASLYLFSSRSNSPLLPTPPFHAGGGGVNQLPVALPDLDNSASGFKFKNIGPGIYSLYVSGNLSTDGVVHNTAFAGANYNVTAVPEPETYAMFLAGLGLMGVVARRRNQK